MKYQFPLTKREKLSPKPDSTKLGFGNYLADYMTQAIYTEGQGWHGLGVVPYGPISITPAASVFHYGQEMFEGLKAFKRADGSVWMFRPRMNAIRANETCYRVAMPLVPEDLFIDALVAGLKANLDWIPTEPGCSMYIRPVMFSTEPFLGVRTSNEYQLFMLYSPSSSYYSSGLLTPTRIFVEDQFARAADGGTGAVKTAGNYAASLLSQKIAHEKGFNQVLWTDAATHKNAEEIGTSNAFFVIDGVVVTPATKGTILPGITRTSCIELLKDWGIPVEERTLPVQEIWNAYQKGKLTEVFATGTAAVVSPVGELAWHDNRMIINGNKIGPVASRLYDEVNGIREGKLPDKYGWMYEVK